MKHFVLMLTLLTLTGCAARGPIDVAPPPNSTAGSIDVAPARLAKIMPYAFEAIGWGYARLRHDDQHVAVYAQTPDGRDVDIVGESDDNKTVQLHVRVGHFGDTAMQQQFIDTLNQQVQRFVGKEIR